MAGEREVATTGHRAPPRRAVVVALQLGFFVLVTGLWELLVQLEVIDAFFFSRPSDIAARVWEWLATGYIWRHLAITLVEAMAAFAIGIVSGIAAGLALARVELLAAVFDPYIRVLNAAPGR